MKTILNLTLLALAIALPVVTFAGLVGLLPLGAFIGSEFTFFAFSVVGMMLIALNDNGKGRRPIIVRHAPPAALPGSPCNSPAYGTSYGLRRKVCTIA